MNAPGTVAPAQRLWRPEDPVGDFLFYNGAPVPISSRQWLFVMAQVAPGHWKVLFGLKPGPPRAAP